MTTQPHVVIVGGGFGGLYAAKALRRVPVQVTLVDRTNHHLFQPLLYEVATAALSAPDVAQPIRRILARQKNVQVLLADARSIDTERRLVVLGQGDLAYDYCIVATGVRHAYFGNEHWAPFAPGLKTVEDALEIRRRFLLAFEAAEREGDEAARQAKLTFIIVGAGPTGVELAGTMSEIARRSIPRDFRFADTSEARVILVEALDRVLPSFSPGLSARARDDLAALGVEVSLNQRVTHVDEHGVRIGDERIDAENVFWAAGVAASPLGATLGAPLDASGRVEVSDDLSLPEHREVFVIGDLAAVKDPRTGESVPGVAPAAVQMGRHVARIISAEVRDKTGDARGPFRFRNRGMLATIGRARAVGMVGKMRLTGVVAWLVWALAHIFFLIGFRSRMIVMLQWAWSYFIFSRGARLILGASGLDLANPARAVGDEASDEVTERRSDEGAQPPAMSARS